MRYTLEKWLTDLESGSTNAAGGYNGGGPGTANVLNGARGLIPPSPHTTHKNTVGLYGSSGDRGNANSPKVRESNSAEPIISALNEMLPKDFHTLLREVILSTSGTSNTGRSGKKENDKDKNDLSKSTLGLSSSQNTGTDSGGPNFFEIQDLTNQNQNDRTSEAAEVNEIADELRGLLFRLGGSTGVFSEKNQNTLVPGVQNSSRKLYYGESSVSEDNNSSSKKPKLTRHT